MAKPTVNINNAIRATEVRVIGPDSEQLGVIPTSKALELAEQQQLDLVEVSPTAVPPVCRIMDYGKFKYQQSKKLQEARKKQVHVEVKEIKLRPKTDDHDLMFKVKHVRRFLEEGNKAKVTLVFRGREITHMDIGRAVIQRFAAELEDIAVIESQPRVDGRNMYMIVAPKVKKVT
ncbi:MAG: translation initiation factor IF-3 [Desulfuromonadales bacterium]|nr:translation initiation factor IF-3 [Desulfuromonadales bacterium]